MNVQGKFITLEYKANHKYSIGGEARLFIHRVVKRSSPVGCQ